jgi:sec-independent protein translocase protein TatC
MKVSFVSALILSLPLILLQLGSFIGPALSDKEKKLVFPFSLLATLVFYAGILVGYFFVLPYVFGFLVQFNLSQQELPLLRLADYLVLTLQLLISTALILEFPVVLLLLGKLGIVNAVFLRHLRPQAYVGLSILAAFLTPTPDAFTMILALVPLLIMYELSIFVIDSLSLKKE